MMNIFYSLIAAGLKNNALTSEVRDLDGFDFANSILPTLIGYAFLIAAAVFVLMLIIGGVQWVSAGSDKGRLESAKARITNAIVGLVVLVVMYALIQLVNQIFGLNIGGIGIGNGGGTCSGSISIQNGNLESGSFNPGWSGINNGMGTIAVSPGLPHSGNFGVSINKTGVGQHIMMIQNVITDEELEDCEVTFSGWARSGPGTPAILNIQAFDASNNLLATSPNADVTVDNWVNVSTSISVPSGTNSLSFNFFVPEGSTGAALGDDFNVEVVTVPPSITPNPLTPTPTPPPGDCVISGPLSVPGGTSATYTATWDFPNGGLDDAYISVTRTDQQGNWQTVYNEINPDPDTWTGSVNISFPFVGYNYYVTCGALDTSSKNCIGNPWCEWEPNPPNTIVCTPNNYNCGLSDTLTVFSAPPNTPTPTVTPTPYITPGPTALLNSSSGMSCGTFCNNTPPFNTCVDIGTDGSNNQAIMYNPNTGQCYVQTNATCGQNMINWGVNCTNPANGETHPAGWTYCTCQ